MQVRVVSATYFGTLAYEIVSQTDEGRITAELAMLRRNPPKRVLLRLPHPQALPIRNVRVNGKRWARFDPTKELVELVGMRGNVTAIGGYG